MQKSFNWLEIVCPLNEAVTSGEKWRARFSHTCSAAVFLKIFALWAVKPIKLWVLEYLLCIFIRRFFFCFSSFFHSSVHIHTLSLLNFAHRSVGILFSFVRFDPLHCMYIVCALVHRYTFSVSVASLYFVRCRSYSKIYCNNRLDATIKQRWWSQTAYLVSTVCYPLGYYIRSDFLSRYSASQNEENSLKKKEEHPYVMRPASFSSYALDMKRYRMYEWMSTVQWNCSERNGKKII